MGRVSIDEKCCATCKWWKGEVKVIYRTFNHNIPTGVEYSPKPCECIVVKNKTNGTHRCDEWVKWGMF
ncbi:MAG: hypothetical protein IJD28_01690 [Deferribacterales bacterium]|nr:hypothetical protein [Deferribacterales bacterium]